MSGFNQFNGSDQASRNDMVRPAGPIDRGLENLGNAISDLDIQVSNLIGKLDSVLGPSYPTPAVSDDSQTMAEASPLTQNLEKQVDRIHDIIFRIVNAKDRIEL